MPVISVTTDKARPDSTCRAFIYRLGYFANNFNTSWHIAVSKVILFAKAEI